MQHTMAIMMVFVVVHGQCYSMVRLFENQMLLTLVLYIVLLIVVSPSKALDYGVIEIPSFALSGRRNGYFVVDEEYDDNRDGLRD